MPSARPIVKYPINVNVTKPMIVKRTFDRGISEWADCMTIVTVNKGAKLSEN